MEIPELEDPRRVGPPYLDGERAAVEAWLEFHRATLLLKTEGLTAEQRTARPVPTSLLSIHGLVRHMAEVERNWFPRVIDGQDLPGGLYWTDDEPDADMAPLNDADWEADLAAWAHWCDVSREVASRHVLDDTGIRHGEPVSLRWVYLHMIEEYARHNGHADLLRELAGGSVWE